MTWKLSKYQELQNINPMGASWTQVENEWYKTRAHYANQYKRYESKNRFVNPFETNGNIFIDIKFSKKYMTDKRPLEIFWFSKLIGKFLAFMKSFCFQK